MAVAAQRAVIQVVGVESLVGGYPHVVVALQHVGDVESPELLHGRSYLAAFQPATDIAQAIEAAVDIDPYGAVLVDVAQMDVGGIAEIAATADVADTAVGVEGIAEDAVACHMPQAALAVAVNLDGLAHQPTADITIAVGRSDTVHGAHVQHQHALVVGYPQALVTVFGKALARVADAAAAGRQARSEKAIAVVAHGTTAIAGHPDKAATVHEDVVDIVVGQAGGQVEAGDVITLQQRRLRPTGNNGQH